MTTITIEQDIPGLTRTKFETWEDLLTHLLENEEVCVLESLEPEAETPERRQKFDEALKTPKSKMLNL